MPDSFLRSHKEDIKNKEETKDKKEAKNKEESSDNSVRLGIDEFFHDSTLTQLIDSALANNLEMGVLNEEVQIAKNDVMARQGAYLPFVSFFAGGGFDKPSLFTREGAIDNQLDILPGQTFPNPLWNTMAGVNVLWQIDIWRQLRNARDAAIHRYVSASEKRNFFVAQLVADVAENYYHLIALDKHIENLDRPLDFSNRDLKFPKLKKMQVAEQSLLFKDFKPRFARTKVKNGLLIKKSSRLKTKSIS